MHSEQHSDGFIRYRAYRILDKNGNALPNELVEEGDLIEDFKGQQWLFLSIFEAEGMGTDHKIYARKPNDPRSHRLLFPSQFGLVIKQD